uniref:Ig-like domain-containing protein n=1 Tax=Poecilia mexicana TaxID=48701 RepID=A0A3B3XIW2_9TELE
MACFFLSHLVVPPLCALSLSASILFSSPPTSTFPICSAEASNKYQIFKPTLCSVHPGEVLKLSCPLPVTGTITWTKDGGSLGTNNRTLIEQEVLQIRDAMPKDSGLYACTSVGKDTVCFIVNVTDATWSGDDEDDTDRSEDTWADSAPYWTSPEKMKNNFHLVPAATTVKFRCAAGGFPQPTLRWLKNGRPLRQEDRMGGYKVKSRQKLKTSWLFLRGDFVCVKGALWILLQQHKNATFIH